MNSFLNTSLDDGLNIIAVFFLCAGQTDDSHLESKHHGCVQERESLKWRTVLQLPSSIPP